MRVVKTNIKGQPLLLKFAASDFQIVCSPVLLLEENAMPGYSQLFLQSPPSL